MYARSNPFPTYLLQPPPNLPKGPRPVGVLVLGLPHLGVGELAPLGDEDRVPPEPALPPRLWRYGSPDLSLKDAHLPAIRNRHGADRACSPIPAAEHPEEPLVADAREEPLGKRPRQPVPGPYHEPRVLDEDGVGWSSKGVVS
jgi:hypothetical protein